MEKRIEARHKRQKLEGEPWKTPFERYEAMPVNMVELEIKLALNAGSFDLLSIFHDRLK